MTAPPHLKALHQLKKARVDFVIVGATAIDLCMFKVGGVALPCAALEHVLESKKQAGRKKDKALLQLVKATQGDPDKPSPAERKRFEAFRAKLGHSNL